MFTTMAHEADYVMLLTRTNTEAAKHRGLTVFLVPMDAPGIEVQGIETLGRDAPTSPSTTTSTFPTRRASERWTAAGP